MLGSVRNAFGVEIKRSGEFQSVLTGHGEESKKKTRKEKDEEEEKKIKTQLVEVGQKVENALDKSGMKGSADVMATPDGVRVRVKGEALFASGSYEIKPESAELLKKLAQIIRKTRFTLTVEGHTDNVPMTGGAVYKSNWELSAARAAVVTRYLIRQRIPPDRLRAAGYGFMRPIASNHTPEGRAKNRRVEFLVKK